MNGNGMTDSQRRQLEVECAAYLSGKPGGPELLKALGEKFTSIGRIGGTLTLPALTAEEAEFLRSLLGKTVDRDAAVIKVTELGKAFQGTRFEGVTLQGVLEAYFSGPLMTRKEEDAERRAQKRQFFYEILSRAGSEPIKAYASDCLSTPESSRFRQMTLLYNADREALRRQLLWVDEALVLVSERERPMTLPVLSALVTQNPHAFDEGTDLHKLLIHVLAYDCDEEIEAPANAEARSALLYRWGIINDTGHRTVMTYGLKALSPDGRSLGWEGFAARREPLVLGMQNLSNIGRVQPAIDGSGHVYCFENPSVFQYVIASQPEAAVVCTKGQLNQAAWTLLDQVAGSGLKLVYSGDFDPEGLLIAQRLKHRYKDRLAWLCYTTSCCAAARSEVSLEEKRLAQLSKLEDPALLQIAGCLRNARKAGYEESILDRIVNRVAQLEAQACESQASWISDTEKDRERGV